MAFPGVGQSDMVRFLMNEHIVSGLVLDQHTLTSQGGQRLPDPNVHLGIVAGLPGQHHDGHVCLRIHQVQRYERSMIEAPISIRARPAFEVIPEGMKIIHMVRRIEL